jgi:hypothetical protein
MKAPEAARYCGGISLKLLYDAARKDRLRTAKIGCGRNLLFERSWCDAWLQASAAKRGPDKAVHS